MRALFFTFSWQELRHHPWRHGAAAVAVMLGVALAFSVHLINASALDEFAGAVRSVNGQPDLSVRAPRGELDEQLLGRLAQDADVALASPVLEISTYAVGKDGQRKPVQIVGVDALRVGSLAPSLQPRPGPGADRLAVFSPGMVFLNPAARQAFGTPAQLQVQHGLTLHPVIDAGDVSAAGPALLVMDIAAAQELFGRLGRLSRIDLRLAPGVAPGDWTTRTTAQANWPAGLTLARPEDATQRMDALSRAYRVNLTVLALVALFTGAFLVFSVLSLSVAQRAQQLALLGVLGLSGRDRLRLVLAEACTLGLAGSLAGLALGTALAQLALKLLGGDLGSGYFAGVAPALQWRWPAAVAYGLLGVAAAAAGAWWPARQAQKLPPAQTLKGLGTGTASAFAAWPGALLMAGGGALALLPPLWGVPLAAYLSVALLLLGGIVALPGLIALLVDRVAPVAARHLLPMLAVERARRVRESAAVAISGVVAALSLAVALTVMVSSFRQSVTDWLDVVLPADLYVRTAPQTSASDTAWLPAELVQAASGLPGVARVQAQRTRSLLLDAGRPAVTLIARPISDPARQLPLVGEALPVPAGQTGVYVSEAVVALYGAQPGQVWPLFSQAISAVTPTGQAQDAIKKEATYFVAGVWRDYARQFGAVTLDLADYRRLSGDERVNDLALTLAPGADIVQVQQALQALASQTTGQAGLLEWASAREIRALSLRIFDRSFAVTVWLQGVAMAIGLFGVAASFSAQVLARRKEFGLLAHLGLTRRQVLAVVAGEGAVWTSCGVVAGLLLGLAVSVVLVKVVNPQSFHWTMDLQLPTGRLVLMALVVVVAGTVTAWLAARTAAGRDAVMAVKEDW